MIKMELYELKFMTKLPRVFLYFALNSGESLHPLYHSFIQSELSNNDTLFENNQWQEKIHINNTENRNTNKSEHKKESGCHSDTVIDCSELISDFRFLTDLKVRKIFV